MSNIVSTVTIDISSRIEQARIDNGALIQLVFKLGDSEFTKTIDKNSFDMVKNMVLENGVPTDKPTPEILFLTSVYDYCVKPLEVGHKIITPKFENQIFSLAAQTKNADDTYTNVTNYPYQLLLTSFGRNNDTINLNLTSNSVTQADIDGAALKGFTLSNEASGIKIVSSQKEFDIHVIRESKENDVWSDFNGFSSGKFSV